MKLAKKSLLYLVLAGGTVIVLLPLFWMIITACKQTGQALKFQFIPDKMIAGYWQTTATLPSFEPQSPEQKTIWAVEYDPKDYPEVSEIYQVALIGEFNNWESDESILQKDRRTWSIRMPIEPGEYRYRFVVNEQHFFYDRSNPNREDKYSVAKIEPGFNKNCSLHDRSFVKQQQITFQVYAPDTEQVTVEWRQGKEITLQPAEQEGLFVQTTTIPKNSNKYRIKQEIPWQEAWGNLYTLDNFTAVLFNKDFPFASFFLNSLIVATGSALLTVLICLMGGYAFSKKKFFGQNFLFALLLSSMMIPGMIFMVPQFIIVSEFGWMNSYQGMIVPHLANVFGLFLMKQYIDTIPSSLFEAARLDGANELQIFRIILFPLSMPIMATLFLLTFVGQWSNFLWQLIVNTPDSTYRTLPVGLALFKGQYATNWELMMAGACFSIIPIALIFLGAQRFFISGMTTGAVK